MEKERIPLPEPLRAILANLTYDTETHEVEVTYKNYHILWENRVFSCMNKGERINLRYVDILYFTKVNDSLEITTTSSIVTVKYPFDQLPAVLLDSDFIQVTKDKYVNTHYIKEPKKCTFIIMVNGAIMPFNVSPNYREEYGKRFVKQRRKKNSKKK